METNSYQNENRNIYDVLHRVVGIIGMIVITPILLLCILAVAYLLAIYVPTDSVSAHTINELRNTIVSLWQSLLPIAHSAFSAVAPVLVLLVVAGLIRWIIPKEGKDLNIDVFTKNSPAIIAIIIIFTICLLAFTRAEIPGILSNIALIVVGFFFGKQEKKNT